jgi:anaerobic glycerol-3-phosphate dehydrogenase
MHSTEVLIVGGGIAGFAAALAARSRGASTILVRRGPGTTALVAGGWHGVPPAPIVEALADAGLPLEPCAGPLPHPDGRLLPCDLAPRSHADAALHTAGGRVLVVGIEGLPAFRPVALAALWSHGLAGAELALLPCTLRLDGTPPAGWSPVALAAALDRDSDLLATRLLQAVQKHGADAAILPAVLGLAAHTPVQAAVRARVGVDVGEALAVAPSLPGWRLDRAILNALETAGVTVLTGRVEGGAAHGAEYGGVEVGRVMMIGPRASERIDAGAIVLASGKFIGGGIAAAPAFMDTVFSTRTGVARLGRMFEDATESQVLTDAVRTLPQPILRAGIPGDEPLPATEASVFVCGAARAGVDAATLGLGHAARDGWEAGLRAAATAARSGG